MRRLHRMAARSTRELLASIARETRVRWLMREVEDLPGLGLGPGDLLALCPPASFPRSWLTGHSPVRRVTGPLRPLLEEAPCPVLLPPALPGHREGSVLVVLEGSGRLAELAWQLAGLAGGGRALELLVQPDAPEIVSRAVRRLRRRGARRGTAVAVHRQSVQGPGALVELAGRTGAAVVAFERTGALVRQGGLDALLDALAPWSVLAD